MTEEPKFSRGSDGVQPASAPRRDDRLRLLVIAKVASAVAAERERCAAILDRYIAMLEDEHEASDQIAYLRGLAGEMRSR